MYQRQRYFTELPKHNENGIRSAIEKAIELSETLPSVERIVFLINKGDSKKWLREVFSFGEVRKMKKGFRLNGTTAFGYIRDYETYRPQSVEIIVPYMPTPEELFLLEDNPEVAAVVAIIHNTLTFPTWLGITNAVDLHTGEVSADYELPPCIVIKALHDLAKRVRIKAGLSEADIKLAKEFIHALKLKFDLHPWQCRGYLLKKLNWPDVHARRIFDIAFRSLPEKPLPEEVKLRYKEYLNRWIKECNETESSKAGIAGTSP